MPNDASTQSIDSSNSLPILLKQVCDGSATELETLLEEFFARCDDSLFDFAEAAANNKDQNLYFEAMRELRMQKAEVTEFYIRKLKQAFQNLKGPRVRRNAQSVSRLEIDSSQLELVKNEELEESVTVKGIVNQARLRHAEALLQLSARFEHLLEQSKLDDEDNPLDPGNLLELFSQGTASLDIELKLKVFLYKRFDQVVISELGAIYSKANEILIVGGVLPKLKLRARNAANDARKQNTSTQPSSEHYSLTNEPSESAIAELTGLTDLLSALKAGMHTLPGMLNLGELSNGPEVTQYELVGLLNAMAGESANDSQIDPKTTQATGSLSELVTGILQQRKSEGGSTALRSADEHTINLVSMFFDFVLDAEALPIDMQALLARLQIPVLKIALRDRYLFTTKQHPLRNLINEIAQASYGRDVSKPEDAPFFALINEQVQGLINEPELSEADFVDLIANLQDFLSSENQKSEAMEQRVSSSAKTSALARHAREKLRIILQEKFKNKRTPDAVRNFLYLDWHNILLSTYLNHGEQSAEWLEVEQVADDLLWTAQMHTDRKSLQRMNRVCEQLYRTIESNLKAHRTTDQGWNTRLVSIKDLHRHIINGDEKAFNEALSTTKESDTELNMSNQAWESEAVTPNPEFKNLRRIKKLQPGDWIRLSIPGSTGGKFCKVSAYLETDESFLLVNRIGARVAILDCKSLAQSLQDGKLKIMENTPLFDQAVANISSKLRGLSKGDQ
ncbi:MAG: DUF1631 family protein [Pseudomonadales bacterium]